MVVGVWVGGREEEWREEGRRGGDGRLIRTHERRDCKK
jgi:hypothetical protein